MKVKNKKGTSVRSCYCSNWLQHWRKFTDDITYTCKAKGCRRTDIVGAHVLRDVPYDNSEYIVPLCNLHNKATGTVELEPWTKLASANVKNTCGKW